MLGSLNFIFVGGATRNRLWSRLRFYALDIPVRVIGAVTTVLGAAMFGFAGAGVHASPEASRTAFGLTHETVYPNKLAGYGGSAGKPCLANALSDFLTSRASFVLFFHFTR